jgi:hypothetical protein
MEYEGKTPAAIYKASIETGIVASVLKYATLPMFQLITASWLVFLLHVLHKLLCSVRQLPLRLPLYRKRES